MRELFKSKRLEAGLVPPLFLSGQEAQREARFSNWRVRTASGSDRIITSRVD